MKTKLPKKSLVIKEKLEAITQTLLINKHEVAMIILFGSYAKGAWVRDRYVEDGTSYSYESDIDLLVVTKNSRYTGQKGMLFAAELERRLERKGLREIAIGKPVVKIIVESIKRFNKALEMSEYFYSDLNKEGILLYDSGEFKLAEPKELNWQERKAKAVNYFEYWFYKASEFLIECKYPLERGNNPLSAFLLHQATESFYNAILLVFTDYKGKLHDIEILGSLASNYSNELLKIFPRDTEELDKRFVLLKKAYIDARYDKNYIITEEQLLYLISRVEKLKKVTEEICTAWIEQPKLDV